MMFKNQRERIGSISRQPENIILFSTKDIESVTADNAIGSLSNNEKEIIAAEILFRLYLYGSNTEISLINSLKSLVAPEQLSAFTNYVRKNNSPDKWDLFKASELPFPDSINQRLSERIENFISCDGIIPLVVHDSEAIPLPFRLLQNYSDLSNKLIVTDIFGYNIEKWSKDIEELTYLGVYGWKVELLLNSIQDTLPLEGRSFHLPVLMAIEKKEGRVPFNPLRVIFTGAFVNTRLKNVDAINEKYALAKKMSAELFVAPHTPKLPESQNILQLQENSTWDKLQEKINNTFIELGWAELSWREALKELKKLENDVRHAIVSLKDSAIPRLNRIKQAFTRENKQDKLLDVKELEAVILCHLGQPQQAKKMLIECQTIARKEHKIEKYVKDLIRIIVNLTDLGEYNEAFQYDKEIYSMISENNFPDKNDILMRYYGTVGQMYLYYSLNYENKNAAEKALFYFRKAKDCADEHENILNLCKDLNYIHLWYAIYNFNTPEERKVYEYTDNMINKLKDSDARYNNKGYLYRQKAFGAYREFLINQTIYPYEQLNLPENTNSWLYAMTLKYKATLQAAEGLYKESSENFTKSMQILKDDSYLYTYILNMTTAVQAWNSLKNSDFADFAEECREKALRCFSNSSIKQLYKFVSLWEKYLKHPERYENPQLKFQY